MDYQTDASMTLNETESVIVWIGCDNRMYLSDKIKGYTSEISGVRFVSMMERHATRLLGSWKTHEQDRYRPDSIKPPYSL